MKPIVHTKESILEAIRRAAKKLGRAPSGSELKAETGISQHLLRRHFESWPAALRAAGWPARFKNARLEERVLLQDWARVVRRLGRLPKKLEYDYRGKFSTGVFMKRFATWSAIPHKFLSTCGRCRGWSDVRQIAKTSFPAGPSEGQAKPFRVEGLRLEIAKPKLKRLSHRPTYGNPIDFRGLRHEPVNENGVLLLFGAVAKELGFLVESVQSGFPDCEAKREIAPGKWQRVFIEFEFQSRNFRERGHPTDGCDLIVCWRHNWPDCPLEVIELARVISPLGVSGEGGREGSQEVGR